jgi:hypothetical protein
MSVSAASYKLPDEPTPGVLQQLVVNPMWPLFAIMFAGAWLALPWFVFNAFAIGSPTRIKETLIVVIGAAAVAVLSYGVMLGFAQFDIAQHMKYGFQAVVIGKLGLAYWLYLLQGRTFEIYEHFNGKVQNGLLPLLAGAVFLRKYVLAYSDNPQWTLLVS